MARAANLSVSHFTRSFEQETGLSPHRYLLHVRLTRARQLIAQRAPSLSLAEIAATCGFSDQGYMGRHFRYVFCVTPAAFRRAQGRPGDPRNKPTASAPLEAQPSRQVGPLEKCSEKMARTSEAKQKPSIRQPEKSESFRDQARRVRRRPTVAAGQTQPILSWRLPFDSKIGRAHV